MDDGHSAAMEQQASPVNDDDVNDDATKQLHVKASLGGVVGESAQPDNGNDDGDAVGDISDDAVGSVSSSDNDDDDDDDTSKKAAAADEDADTDAVAKVRQDPKNRTVKGAFESDDEDAGAAAGDASQVCAWHFQLSLCFSLPSMPIPFAPLLLSCCTHSLSSSALALLSHTHSIFVCSCSPVAHTLYLRLPCSLVFSVSHLCCRFCCLVHLFIVFALTSCQPPPTAVCFCRSSSVLLSPRGILSQPFIEEEVPEEIEFHKALPM